MLLLLLIDPFNHSNLSSSVLHCPWPLSLITFWQDLASSMSQYKETEYFYLLEKHAQIPSSKIFLNLKIISFKTPTTILIFQTNINHYSSFHLHNIILCKSAVKVSSGWMFPNFTYIHNTNRKNYFYDTLRRYQKVTYDQKVTSPRSSQLQDSKVSCRLFTTSLNLEHKNRFYIYSPPTKGVCVCTYVHTYPYICACIYKWFSNPNWTVFAHFSTKNKNRSLILMQSYCIVTGLPPTFLTIWFTLTLVNACANIFLQNLFTGNIFLLVSTDIHIFFLKISPLSQ